MVRVPFLLQCANRQQCYSQPQVICVTQSGEKICRQYNVLYPPKNTINTKQQQDNAQSLIPDGIFNCSDNVSKKTPLSPPSGWELEQLKEKVCYSIINLSQQCLPLNFESTFPSGLWLPAPKSYAPTEKYVASLKMNHRFSHKHLATEIFNKWHSNRSKCCIV